MDRNGNPFFKTVNNGYGESWQASGGVDPRHMQETPEYKDLGERELALKNSLRTYKHEVLKEMRENGELDTQIYERIKNDMNVAKKSSVIPKDFPGARDEMKYPEPGLNIGNLLYRTSNMGYGTTKPSDQDLPSKIQNLFTVKLDKYFPRSVDFTKQFLGGNFHDTGLNTNKTPSRVHMNYDQ